MSALRNEQRFVVLMLIGLVSGVWLGAGTTAQTFTSEDRGAILKFMDVLINFLDAESDNGTSPESPNNATTTGAVESTTLATNLTTDSTATEATTASNSTIASSESTEATSESTTLATNETSSIATSISTASSSTSDSTTSSSTAQASVAPRRICFKRVCYKFAGDKGYIY